MAGVLACPCSDHSGEGAIGYQGTESTSWAASVASEELTDDAARSGLVS